MLAHHQLPPSRQEASVARASGQLLSRYVHEKQGLTLHVQDAEHGQGLIELPASAVALLMEVLEAMAAGRGVAIIPQNAELTTVEAAEILNVSRPYLIKLLEDGAIPHRKVGKHRRIRMEDVAAYKAQDDQRQEAVLDQLVREAQEQGMGYPQP